MNIEEKIREIMLSEELSDSEKLDRLHALIPVDSFKIDNLSQATPTQPSIRDGLGSEPPPLWRPGLQAHENNTVYRDDTVTLSA